MSRCEQVDETVLQHIRETSARETREGDEAFRLPWELRSFALGVAFYERSDFAWDQFQGRLVEAIDASETAGRPEQYYGRWVEALESMLRERDGIDVAELDRRTADILATPRDATHQHPHDEPVSTDAAHGSQHGHGHSH